MSEHESYGEIHTLIVTEAEPPAGDFDDWHLEYEIEHPPSCRQEASHMHGQPMVVDYTCDVAHHEHDSGLAFCLKYSGTPVTKPGTYKIQAWSRKHVHLEGTEYDGGIGLAEEPGDSV
jgi:hypothetical protein